MRVFCHELTKWLGSHKLQFHMFLLARTKRVPLILHGLDTDSDRQAILDKLRELSFTVVTAFWLHSTVGPRKPIPLARLCDSPRVG